MPSEYAARIIQTHTNQRAYIDSRYEDWFNNIAFYLGYHYQIWDSDIYAFFVPPLQDENQTITYADNLIQSLVDIRVSKLTGNKPILSVVSQDKTAKSTAQAAKETNILKGIWHDLNVQSLLTWFAYWAIICGRCFLRPYWKTKFNKAMIDIIDPYMVLHDETQRPFDNVRTKGWFDITSIQSKQQLINTFPDEKRKIERLTEISKAGVCSVQEKVMQLEDRASKAAREEQYRDDEGKKGGVEIIERYEAPYYSKNEKDGVYAVVAGVPGEEVVIHKAKLPKGSNGKIPIAEYSDMVGLTTLWPRSLVSRSRQSQKVYNHWYSKIIELGMLPPIYTVPRDSGIKASDLFERAYHVIEFDPEEGKFGVVQPNDPPNAWITILTIIRNSIEHLWASHEVTARATTPGGKDMSGRGIAMLQKEDVARLGSPIARWTDCLKDTGDILLGLYRENNSKEQKLYYPTLGGQTAPIKFTKSDISGNNSVYVEVDSEYARNRESTLKLITQFLSLLKNLPNTARNLDNPVQMHKFMSYGDEGIANTFLVKNQPMERAEDENLLMMDLNIPEGQLPIVESYHGHFDHIQVHLGMMRSREFLELPSTRQNWIKANQLIPHLKYWQRQLGGKLPPDFAVMLESKTPKETVFRQSSGELTTEVTQADEMAEAEAQAAEAVSPTPAGEF